MPSISHNPFFKLKGVGGFGLATTHGDLLGYLSIETIYDRDWKFLRCDLNPYDAL